MGNHAVNNWNLFVSTAFIYSSDLYWASVSLHLRKNCYGAGPRQNKRGMRLRKENEKANGEHAQMEERGRDVGKCSAVKSRMLMLVIFKSSDWNLCQEFWRNMRTHTYLYVLRANKRRAQCKSRIYKGHLLPTPFLSPHRVTAVFKRSN